MQVCPTYIAIPISRRWGRLHTWRLLGLAMWVWSVGTIASGAPSEGRFPWLTFEPETSVASLGVVYDVWVSTLLLFLVLLCWDLYRWRGIFRRERTAAMGANPMEDEYQRSLFEKLPVGLALCRLNGELVYVNEAFSKLLGRTTREVLQLTYWDITPESYAASEAALLQETRESGRYRPYEKEYIHKDGHLVPVRLQGVLVEHEGETLIWSSVEDISEARAAEASLRHREEQYRTVFETAPVGLIIFELEGKTVAANPAACSMHGYPLEEFLLLEPTKFIDPSFHPKFAQFMEAVDNGEEIRLTAQDVKKDGTAFDVEVIGAPIQYKGVRHCLGIVQDVTALRESLQAAADIVAAIPSGLAIYQVTPSGGLIRQDANPKASRLMGGAAPHPEGADAALAWVDDSGVTLRSVLLAVHRCGDTCQHNFSTSDGDILLSALRVYAFPMPGERVGVALEDILERKNGERELERYRHQLEELVQDRTKALEDAQHEIVRNERLAALGQLIGTVSHELRNPLGTIRASTFAISSFLKTEQLDRIPNVIARVERSVIRCDRIIEELLDFTRDPVLERREVHIDDWLRGVVADIGVSPEIVCQWDLDAACTLSFDTEQFRRVMINLVTNATHAMEEEGAPGNRLTLATRGVEGGVKIMVSDQGVGMSPDVLAKVFEPLFSTKGFGVGLGVPIIRGIVEAHGGRIRYESTVQQGTTAIVWLPGPGQGPTQAKLLAGA